MFSSLVSFFDLNNKCGDIRKFKMSERKFSRGLGKPGMAAQLRETVSQVVRESTIQVNCTCYCVG